MHSFSQPPAARQPGSSRGNKGRGLSIDVDDSKDNGEDDNYIANGEVFIKDNVAINSQGIAMRDNPKTFHLVYEDLELGDMIGRGCSSVVLHEYMHPLALCWH